MESPFSLLPGLLAKYLVVYYYFSVLMFYLKAKGGELEGLKIDHVAIR